MTAPAPRPGPDVTGRLAEALRLIARPGCHHSTTEQHRCINNPDRVRGARYTGDAWCDACVAAAALRGEGRG